MEDRRSNTRWIDSFKVYKDPKMAIIFFLGFSSGLPLFLTSQTLFLWMADKGVDKSTIGLFALLGLPYTIKFIWSPILDQFKLPFLHRIFGQRRSWLLLTQFGLLASLFALSSFDPTINLQALATCAFIVAVCSASQDIIVDALRIEILKPEQFGAGASAYTFGYRLGMVLSGTVALLIAHFSGWSLAYKCMAIAMFVGIATVLLIKEPNHPSKLTEPKSFLLWLKHAVIEPFTNFLTRKGWLLILLFIPLFKVGDAFVSNMSGPFYLEMGFSKLEIAAVTKVWGVTMSLLGTFIGGLAVARYGIMKGLLYMGILQLLSNGMFAIQALLGHNITFLFVTIFSENLSGSMATTAFIAYLSVLCSKEYTATQYALFASFMGLGRTAFSSGAGFAATSMSWPTYFLFTMALALPALLILLWLMKNTTLENEAVYK